MDESNKSKSIRGRNAFSNLNELLKLCINNKYIKTYETNYRSGYIQFNPKQFHAQFKIVFFNDKKWLLYSTTSLRTDRVKGLQWDSYHIQKIQKDISKCIIVYPDSINSTERHKFIKQNIKYTQKKEFSSINYVISQSELYQLIEEYALKGKSKGHKYDLKGKNFENHVAAILFNSDNLNKLKGTSSLSIGLNYNVFSVIVTTLGIDLINLSAITATTDIPKLPNKGIPKTDILVTAKYNNSSKECYKLSCKRTSKNHVTVHQYTADAFSNTLDPSNHELRKLLNMFQNVGSIKKFGKDNEIALTNKLKPYNVALTLWALGGIGGIGNPEIHWASHLLIFIDERKVFSLHHVNDYINLYKSNNVHGNFGTFFKWTYPSKQRGKYIQLKSQIFS